MVFPLPQPFLIPARVRKIEVTGESTLHKTSPGVFSKQNWEVPQEIVDPLTAVP